MFFLFPGQGSQVPGMGHDFYEGSQAAREMFDRAAAISPPEFLHRVFAGSEEDLRDTCLAQPALLVVEVAIARHLVSLGCRPSGVAGHSLGEISALTAGGALAFDDAIRLVQARARAMAEYAPPGGMIAVIGMPAETIQDVLPAGVEIANYNGPDQTIVSGTLAALEQAERRLKEAGARRVVRLAVSGPFHSTHMRAAAEVFREALQDVPLRAPSVRFVSSVTGKEVSDPSEIRSILGDQMCSPVQWTRTMQCIGPVDALEAGPGRVLQGLAKRTPGAPTITPVGTLAAANALEKPA